MFAPSANPVSDAARARIAREPKHLTAAAELLPADKLNGVLPPSAAPTK
jgi:hypothetical protein